MTKTDFKKLLEAEEHMPGIGHSYTMECFWDELKLILDSNEQSELKLALKEWEDNH